MKNALTLSTFQKQGKKYKKILILIMGIEKQFL